jgi:cytochrome P450
MTQIIKEITLKEIKKLQEQPNLDNYNMTDFTLQIQARIIINIMVGKGYSNRTVRWEENDGKQSTLGFGEGLIRCISFAFSRSSLPINVLIPEARNYHIHANDRRHYRNVMSVRALIQEMMNDRRKNVSQSYTGDDADLLSIMLKSKIFEGQDDRIINELFGFFLAGMKTVQMSTTNLLYYVARDKRIREKLMAEILPPVERVSNNLQEGLEFDTVMEFEYL